MNNDREIVVKMVLDGWHFKVKQMDTLLSQLSDDELWHEVAPGKFRGIYLLGHLTATHDKLFRILNICQVIFPEYETLFIETADNPELQLPSVEEVKMRWLNVNIQLARAFQEVHPNEWFRHHAMISESDFEKERHRNKLNVMLHRTGHLGYHLGQMVLLKNRIPRPEYH